MSKNLPIGPIPGVPDLLIEVLNDRFRRSGTGEATTTVASPVKDGKRGGTGAQGPPGTPGSSGPAPLPPLLVSGDVAIALRWDQRGNVYDLGFDITITPSEGADTTKIAAIRITREGTTAPTIAPDSTTPRLELTVLPGPYADSVAVTYSSNAYPYDINQGPVSYWMEFQTLNTDLVAATGDPLLVEVPVVPMAFTSVVSAAESTRYNDDPIARGLKVDIDIVVRVTDNPGAGLCTKWLDRNDGNGNQWCGWEPLTGNGDLHVSILNQPPGLVDTNWTVTCAPGAVDEFDPIPATAVSKVYIQHGPAILANNVVTAARFGAINYTPVALGIYGFSWDHIPATVDRANPNIWFLRVTAQDCDVSGTPAPDDRGRERGSFNIPGSVADEGLRWTWSGTALDILPLPNDAIWGPVRTDAYRYTKVRIYAVSRAGGPDGTATLQACWTGTEPADCVNAVDHLSATIIQDASRGKVPPAPTIVTATATANYQRNGHDFEFFPSGSFTAPADPFGALAYVRAELLNPAGSVVEQLDIPGPFTPTTVYPFANMPTVAVPSASQTWHVRYTPFNSADVPGTGVSAALTVGPNTVFSLVGSEGTRYIEGAGGSKTHINFAISLSSGVGPGVTADQPQTGGFFFSSDSGAHWFTLGLRDLSVLVSTQSFELWRSVISAKTCKIAVALGAPNLANGTFNDASPIGPIADADLPANTFRAPATFNLPRVGAPLASDVTAAAIMPRTASPGALYNDVVIGPSPDGTTPLWGLPDGITWSNPPITTDPDLFRTIITVQVGHISGGVFVPAAAEEQGVERAFASWGGDPSQVGPYVFPIPIFWTFNGASSIETVARFRIYGISRSATDWNDPTFSTLQTTAWSGASFKYVVFGTPPSSTLVIPPAAAPVTFPNMVLSYSLGANGPQPMFAISAVITFPSAPADIAKIGAVELDSPPSLGFPPLIIPAANTTGWSSLLVGGTLTLSLTAAPQPLLDTVYQVTAYPLDTALKRGPSIVRTITVPAAVSTTQPPSAVYIIDSVTLSENARGRDLGNTVSLSNLVVSIRMHQDYGGIALTVYYSYDATSLGDQGHTFYWKRVTQTVKGNTLAGGGFQVPVPAFTQFVQVAVALGNIPGDPSQTITAANLPAGAVKSNVFQLNGLPAASAAPGANVVASASLGTVTHAKDTDGLQDWLLRNITWTDVSPIVDPYAKQTYLIAFICNAAGVRATSADGGDDAVVAMYGVDGTTHATQNVKWWGFPNDTTMDRARFRLECDNGGGLRTVQNCWAGGAAFSDAVFGTSTGQIRGNRLDPVTIGAGLALANRTTGGATQLESNNNNSGTSLINDWNFESSPAGQIPTTSMLAKWWQFGPGAVTIRTDGGFSGNNYARIAGANTQLIYKMDLPPNTPFYLSITTRGSGATQPMVLFYLWYDKTGNFIGGANSLGSISAGGGSWVKDGVAGVVTPTSPSTAGIYIAIANSGSEGGFWDVDCAVARQVLQQTQNGLISSGDAAPFLVDQSALRTYTGADQSVSNYGHNSFYIVPPNGIGIFAGEISNLAGTFQLQVGTGVTETAWLLTVGSGTTQITQIRGTTSYVGQDTSFKDQAGVTRTFKGGILIG